MKEIEHMSDKTFSSSSKSKDEQILAFEQDRTERSEAIRQTERNATKRLSLDLPKSMHTRFKTACSATGRKMVAELQSYIEQRIQELEAEAGITHK